jgi:hypothetical protein
VGFVLEYVLVAAALVSGIALRMWLRGKYPSKWWRF